MKLEIMPNLVGPAKDGFHGSAENVLLSFEELMEKLATLFNVKEDKIKMRRDLEEPKLRPGERLVVYVRAKMMLGEELKMEEKDLMQYIIDGVDETHMKVQLQIARIRTVRELIDRVMRALRDYGIYGRVPYKRVIEAKNMRLYEYKLICRGDKKFGGAV